MNYRYSLAVTLTSLLFLNACSSEKPTPSGNTTIAEDADDNNLGQLEPADNDRNGCGSASASDAAIHTTNRSINSSPINKVFWKDSTVLLELFVYRKEVDCPSTLLESYQADRNVITAISDAKTLDEVDPILVLKEINRVANAYYGARVSEFELANDFPVCRDDVAHENPYNYIARTTDDSGDTVTLINGGACGKIPDFQFEDIDGASPYDNFLYLRNDLARALN